MKILTIQSKTFGTLQVKLDNWNYESIIDFGKWSASKDRGKYYFHKRISKNKKITLHRYLMGFPKDKYVDHINGDTLDNRVENLRICSNSANLRNGKIRSNNTSGIIGVRFDKSRNKWTADIKVRYKKIFLGRFEDKDDAILAREKAERKYYDY